MHACAVSTFAKRLHEQDYYICLNGIAVLTAYSTAGPNTESLLDMHMKQCHLVHVCVLSAYDSA